MRGSQNVVPDLTRAETEPMDRTAGAKKSNIVSGWGHIDEQAPHTRISGGRRVGIDMLCWAVRRHTIQRAADDQWLWLEVERC
jgi:hypothetical protein